MGGRNGSGIGGDARCWERAATGASRHGEASVPLNVASMPRQAVGHSHSPLWQAAGAATSQQPAAAIAAECGAAQCSWLDGPLYGDAASASAGAFSTRATSNIQRSSRPGRFTRR